MSNNNELHELTVRAQNNGLTVEDINHVVVAIANKLNANESDIRNLKAATSKTERSVRDIEEEYPLLPPEADDLSKAVKRKGVRLLGGKNAPAYKDTALRRDLYMDIYSEIKRQYGLIDEYGKKQSYKKLKRKYLAGAFRVVDDYILPIALENRIEEANELDEE